MADNRETSEPDHHTTLEDRIRELVDVVVEDSRGPVTAAEAMSRVQLAARGTSGQIVEPTRPSEVSEAHDGQPRNGRWLVAAAAVVLLTAGASLVYLLVGGTNSHQVATTPVEQDGFESWGPGWHQIDRSGLPAMAISSIAWFKGRLIVVGGSMEIRGDQQAAWREVARAYDPATKRWAQIPGPGLAGASLVVAGDRLVAVGAGSVSIDKPNTVVSLNHWATWTGGDAEWVDQQVMPANDEIERLGPTGVSSDRARYLIWTGKALLDFTSGTVLHPETGKMGLIELPRGVLTYRYLSRSTPVWTGSEVVWPAAGISSDAVGLRWASDGTDVAEIPAPPPEVFGDSPSDGPKQLLVFAARGDVIVIAGDGPAEPYVQSFDTQTNRWSSLAGTERLAGPECFNGGSTTGGDLVLIPCSAADDPVVPMIWRNGKWFNTEPLPAGTTSAPYVLSAQADSSLIIWSLPSAEPGDTREDFAAVWVPQPTSRLTPAIRKSERAESTTTLPGAVAIQPDQTTTTLTGDDSSGSTSLGLGTVACTEALAKLPTLKGLLPADLDTGPNPGTGGAPDVPTCARFWGSSSDPGVHATQGLGPSPFGGPELGRTGDYAWSEIEDGWKIEYFGTDLWHVNLYGVTQQQVADLMRSLVKL